MKVYLDTVGCRLNQSEIETYARQFSAAGYTLVATMEEADLMVLNTCAVTAPAASDSRQKIRQARRAGVDEIVVTGCWSTLKPEKAAAMPGVTRVVPNVDKDTLVPDLLQIDVNEFDLEPIAREPVPGARMRTRAFIKVQDGCDNRCTFCVTTVARGAGRSRSVMDVVADVRSALKGGAQEVVLTGVHLGSWGHDFEQPEHLRQLVEKILEINEVPRLRLSSLEPWDLDAEFFDLWRDPRLCRHLHLPLQSGCGRTLRRMARKTTPENFGELVAAARQRIPGVAITTDVIVGFPGETDAEFAESLDFVKSINFAGGHVFTYSARPGTAAARMPNQVHNYTRKERSAAMRAVLEAADLKFRQQFVGTQQAVLWETVAGMGGDYWELHGLTDNYLRVVAKADRDVWNQITTTHLTAVENGSLRGEIAFMELDLRGDKR
ncbi:MAG: tRNA (N(6)-L-threonylcarbamoyladenosine(37)-C(2))-methylthiotransferase MtaB [Anaerolineales bacterium]|nr:tRNA (N(6)-L-threonylcarbamoyladenosine(37)-C(2))-methylthiotransferase MtaB [Anaerolineales bacterium]